MQSLIGIGNIVRKNLYYMNKEDISLEKLAFSYFFYLNTIRLFTFNYDKEYSGKIQSVVLEELDKENVYDIDIFRLQMLIDEIYTNNKIKDVVVACIHLIFIMYVKEALENKTIDLTDEILENAGKTFLYLILENENMHFDF